MSDKSVREYLASIGRKRGQATGESKLRGGPEYHKTVSARAAREHANKRAEKKKAPGR
jgi:hypothetical protein